MIQTKRLSQLMKLSWEIQRKKHHTRSKSLQAAWAIATNEDITIFYLVKRHSNENHVNKVNPGTLMLFNSF